MTGKDKEILVELDSVRLSLISDHHVVTLKEVEGKRYLGIWTSPSIARVVIAANEANYNLNLIPDFHAYLWSIKWLLGREQWSYPQLSALNFRQRLSLLWGSKIDRVVVTGVSDRLFFSTLHLKKADNFKADSPNQTLVIAPTSAIILALRTQNPILVLDSLLQKHGALLEIDANNKESFREIS